MLYYKTPPCKATSFLSCFERENHERNTYDFMILLEEVIVGMVDPSYSADTVTVICSRKYTFDIILRVIILNLNH